MASQRDISRPSWEKPRAPPGPKPKRQKYGGRTRGRLNKATIEKELLAKQQLLGRKGIKLAVEHMDDALVWIRGAMAITNPWNPDGSTKMRQGLGPDGRPAMVEAGDIGLFLRLIELLRDFSVARAPYQSPRLSAVQIVPAGQQGQGPQRTVVNVTILDAGGNKVYSDADRAPENAKLIEHDGEAA